jgi:hypothetical protein
MSDEHGITGQAARTPRGVWGAPAERAKRWEQRQHLRVIEAAVYQGWDVPAEAYQTIPRELFELIIDPLASPRDRIRAVEALAHLNEQRVHAAVQLDRIMRLDAGTATERIALVDSLTDAQLEAVARSMSTGRKR